MSSTISLFCAAVFASQYCSAQLFSQDNTGISQSQQSFDVWSQSRTDPNGFGIRQGGGDRVIDAGVVPGFDQSNNPNDFGPWPNPVDVRTGGGNRGLSVNPIGPNPQSNPDGLPVNLQRGNNNFQNTNNNNFGSRLNTAGQNIGSRLNTAGQNIGSQINSGVQTVGSRLNNVQGSVRDNFQPWPGSETAFGGPIEQQGALPGRGGAVIGSVGGNVPQQPRPQQPDGFINVQNPIIRDPDAVTEPSTTNIVVKVAQGEIAGQVMKVTGVPWTPGRSAEEVQAPDRGRQDISPLHVSNDIDVYTFLGVPYARKPVQNLRFQAPQRLDAFPEGRVNAFEFGPSCAQDVEKRPELVRREPYEYKVDEDCLYLNVFTPDISRTRSTGTLDTFPVIAFIHGGSFQYGSSSDWPGHVLASKGVVVVTINYRLGPFGFLSRGDGSPANNGLLDQRMALMWIRDNIYAFNGDPQRIALVGHGAGAVSVGLHMLSEGSFRDSAGGMFHVAAALSGADIAYHQVITDNELAFNNTRKLGKRLGCSQRYINEIYDCILTRGTQDVIQGTNDIRLEFNRFAFLPTVDGHFLKASPRELLDRKEVFVPVPLMVGVNGNDGSETLLSDKNLQILDYTFTQNYFEQAVIEYTLYHNYTFNREAIMQAIMYQYSYWPNLHDDDRVRQQYMQLASDAYYISPSITSARLHAFAGSIVFQRVNNYVLGTTGQRDGDIRASTVVPDWLGAFHHTDLYLLFGFPWMAPANLPYHLRSGQAWTQMDRNMSVYYMESMRQFAKTKNPNLYLDGTWVNINERDNVYLDVNVTRKMREDYRWEKVAFWDVYLKQVSNLWTTSVSPTISSLLWERSMLQGVSSIFVLLSAFTAFVAGALGYLYYSRRHMALLYDPQPIDNQQPRAATNQNATSYYEGYEGTLPNYSYKNGYGYNQTVNVV